MRLLLLSIFSLALGTAQVTSSADFQQARKLYYLGSAGDKTKYEEADQIFTRLYLTNKTDPSLEAYYGSLRLLEASHTWALWKKNSLSKQGITLLDSAVTAAPNNLEIRFVRAATTYELPSFFKRREQSKSDFDLLAMSAVEASRNGSLDPKLAAASLYYHAEFLKQDGQTAQAADCWKQAIKLDPQSRAAHDSQKELKSVSMSN